MRKSFLTMACFLILSGNQLLFCESENEAGDRNKIQDLNQFRFGLSAQYLAYPGMAVLKDQFNFDHFPVSVKLQWFPMANSRFWIELNLGMNLLSFYMNTNNTNNIKNSGTFLVDTTGYEWVDNAYFIPILCFGCFLLGDRNSDFNIFSKLEFSSIHSENYAGRSFGITSEGIETINHKNSYSVGLSVGLSYKLFSWCAGISYSLYSSTYKMENLIYPYPDTTGPFTTQNSVWYIKISEISFNLFSF